MEVYVIVSSVSYNLNMDQTKPVFKGNVDLFACIAVKDYEKALAWYQNLFGCPATYVVSEEEALWELAEHRSIVIEHRADRAGRAMHTIFIEQFDEFIESLNQRGVHRDLLKWRTKSHLS